MSGCYPSEGNKMKFEWENIFVQYGSGLTQIGTRRAKVLGGWIISNSISINKHSSTSLVFIPDPEHKWEIEK